MPQKLSTTISKISQVRNSINSSIIHALFIVICNQAVLKGIRIITLKAIIAFANFIGPNVSFYDIHSREQIT
jgi:hypothetical protein